jgi:hypothetical protein
LYHLSRCSDYLQRAFLCCSLLCHGLHFTQISKDDTPATAPLNKGQLLRTSPRPLKGSEAIGYSSSDCPQHQSSHFRNVYRKDRYLGHQFCDPVELASTPELSSISGAKTETSIGASVRTSSSPEEVDGSGELSASVSNASDEEREWVEEDEPGVYITIRALPGSIRELRRVRFRFAVFCLGYPQPLPLNFFPLYHFFPYFFLYFFISRSGSP